jgi:DNA-binding MarR family transcriptional regulator
MLDSRIRRLLDAYPAIFLACHRRHVRQDAAGLRVTERQASVLDHLHPVRPTSLSQLAEHLGVGRSAMSIIVTRLVRQGYVAKVVGRQDSRRVDLTLTPSGAKIKEQNTILDPDLVMDMFRPMRAEQLEIALQGIERLAEYARILLRKRKRRLDR